MRKFSITTFLIVITLGYVAASCVTTSGILIEQAFADSGSAVILPPPDTQPAPEVKPSDKLHDPLTAPIAAWDDLKAAKKQGWAAAILCALVLLTATFARASSRWPKAFGWAAKHKTAIIVVGAVGATAAAAFDTLVLGGSWMSVVMASGGSLLALIAPTHTEPAK